MSYKVPILNARWYNLIINPIKYIKNIFIIHNITITKIKIKIKIL